MNLRLRRPAAPFARSAALAALCLATAGLLPAPAAAHRAWLLPSATVLSGQGQAETWVTIDAAVSNDLFYFEHQPMRLDQLVVFAPDGTRLKAENASTGRYRSTFDVKLVQPGTYRIAVVNDGLFASFKQGGENKRLRGSAESLAKEIPADAQDLRVMQNLSRTEVFVTSGKPTTKALEPTGRGIELVPVTHPNDLIAGEPATFRFLQDGKPAPGLEVSVVPGGIRYRDQLGETKYATDAKGEVTVEWPAAGMYWLNASPPRPAGGPGGPGGPAASGAGGPPPGEAGTLASPVKRANYVVTLEVLSP